MQKSDYMAMMQRDDDTLGSAELIAAYEQGIDDLRSAVAGMTAGAGARPARPRQVEHAGVRRPPRRHRDLLHRPHRADDRHGPPAPDECGREALHRAARLPGVRPRRATGPVHGPAAARRPHPAGAAARGVAAHRRPQRVGPRSPCGNWCCRPCGTCGTTCRSSPRSGRRWGWASREHDPRTSRRQLRPDRRPMARRLDLRVRPDRAGRRLRASTRAWRWTWAAARAGCWGCWHSTASARTASTRPRR